MRDLPGSATDQGGGQRRAARHASGGPGPAAHGPGHDRDHRHHAGRHRDRGCGDHRRRPRACRSSASTARPARRRWPSTSPRSPRPGRGRSRSCRTPACPSWSRARPAIRSGPASSPPGSSASWSRTGSGSSAAAAAPRPSTSGRSIACCAGLAEDGYRPRPKPRAVTPQPQLASLYSAVPLRQENAYLSIGERCNANGSRAFRDRQAAADWDGCVAIGRAQVKEGAHALDVCTAYVGRDEIADMTEVVRRLRGAVDSPLVFDFDRAAGARDGARALRRQGGAELDQLRGRRGAAGAPPRARAQVRRRGDRAHDRRDRHGQGGRAQGRGRPAAWSSSPASATACSTTISCSTP